MTKHAYFSLYCTLSLIWVLSAGSARSYELSGARWVISEGESVPFQVSNVLSDDLSDAECLTAVQQGFDVWTDLTCSYMSWVYDGRTDNSRWGVGDGANVVSWRENNWQESSVVLAITSTIWGGGSNGYTDTDIKFNGDDHTWFTDTGGDRSGTDVISVAAHEVGHAIGLDHSDVPTATMAPSTQSGDRSGRTLERDDMEGACALYPSGGVVPEPVPDPESPEGTATFGESCEMNACQRPTFCVSEGDDRYCSQICDPIAQNCPDGFHCAYLSDGEGACARGDMPMDARATFGEACGNEVLCAANLVCIRDDRSFYCSGACEMGACPDGYFCASLANGGSVCARGERREREERPQFGEPCSERGLCDAGLFCFNDPLYVDRDTGEISPYCSSTCTELSCPEAFRCISVPPRGSACQKVPSAGNGVLGQTCWLDPEQPWLPPSCGDGLVCVDTVTRDGEIVEPGLCTMNCDPEKCCPDGWGCAAVTPVFAQCREGASDSVDFECATKSVETTPTRGKGGGCQQHTHACSSSWFSPFMFLLGVVVLRRRESLFATHRA